MKRKKGPEKGPGNQEREKQADTFQVDFEFYDPEESDFHSVRELLCTGVLRSADLDFSGLADSIVEQVNIGTTVKSGGEEEGSEKSEDEGAGEDEDEDAALCGFLTCLNLHQFSEKDWRKGLVSLLETKAQSAGIGVSEKLKKFVSADTQPGLLVSERFVNLPLELVPMLHKAVLEDIRWSQSTEHCPSEERPFYFFTHFLLLARCHAAETGSPVDGRTVAFARPEDEAFARTASLAFSFPLGKGQKAGGDGRGGRGPKKRRRPAQGSGVDAAAPSERVAVLGFTRAAYEKAVAGLRKALESGKG
ncbi:bcp1 [Symbiodinium microadriaticum]|nr:bcp1 [Symbiodinium microadriaticum]CAE7924202.1 bcp1 [Symbiodinium sp. KB8]